ncbi:MAG: choice-of-anchor U domain-containing protein, partial [Candidatus Saccharimonadales bacterium]
GFSAGGVNDTTIAFDGNTPYVAYMDYASGNKVTVMKFDGNSWQNVGSAGFSAGQSNYISLALDGDTPYVAYMDYGDKATVMKFDGTSWVNVGSAGFSAGQAAFISLKLDGDTPYVAYSDSGNGYKATVMKFDGTSWVNVGSAGFSPNTANYTSMAFNDNTPYVAYSDAGSNYKATVMKFDGTSWQTVGSAGFSVDIAGYTALTFNNGTPYVAYQDGASSGKATVMGLYTNQKTALGATSTSPVTLSTPIGTNITNLTTTASSTKDAGYTYPLDLVDFSATVPGGSTNQVTLTFQTDLKPSDVTARKYNSTTKKYADIPGATITETTVNSKHALQLAYDITDGGALDQDGIVNSVIVDPVGLATVASTNGGNPNQTTPKTPDTGYGAPQQSNLVVTVLVIGAISVIGAGLALIFKSKHNLSK